MLEKRTTVSEPCQRSKKKNTARTSESGKSYQYRCPTRVEHWYFVKNGVSVQPRQYTLQLGSPTLNLIPPVPIPKSHHLNNSAPPLTQIDKEQSEVEKCLESNYSSKYYYNTKHFTFSLPFYTFLQNINILPNQK